MSTATEIKREDTKVTAKPAAEAAKKETQNQKETPKTSAKQDAAPTKESTAPNSETPEQETRFGFGWGFFAGLVVAIALAAYPAILTLDMAQEKQFTLVNAQSENFLLKQTAVKKELASIDKQLIELDQADAAHKALMAKKPELESRKNQLEQILESYIAAQATAKPAEETLLENIANKLVPQQ